MPRLRVVPIAIICNVFDRAERERPWAVLWFRIPVYNTFEI
jgi:hypothetical protein